MQTRYVREVGTRVWLAQRWGACARAGGAPHAARVKLLDAARAGDATAGGTVRDHVEERWPGWCAACGAPAVRLTRHGEGGLARAVERAALYDSRDGALGPGDVFAGPGGLAVVVPGGAVWALDARAPGCAAADSAHSCTRRSGALERLTVVGGCGETTADGLAIAAVGGWRGVLRAGVLETL